MNFDVIIIGVGQAGLSMGYQLSKTSKRFLILDQGKRVGDVWRYRYDSLILFTPRSYSSLPGLKMGGNLNGLPSKDEVADYLEQYAYTFDLPIQLETEVLSLRKEGETFSIESSKGTLHTKEVIVATGPFQTPAIPLISKKLSKDVCQLHSSDYHNPSQLKDGNVLVIGGGNSGAQIAVELTKTKEVHLSVSENIRYLPLSFLGHSIFWWFDRMGILKAKRNSFIGRKIRSKGDPIFGYNLKQFLNEKKITLHPRTKDCIGNIIQFRDQHELEVQNVIWATGFSSNYDWIQIPTVCDKTGNPIHNRGMTNIKGLYFLGQPWQHKRGSALLLGVGEDAEFITNQL
ncbi:NAD(P)/FAD-dependent oxidoreductase [Bacillus sp. CECT 9360]|uniref:flavin-containing monooxygenase n=1 Tax=Bacillus sp. CECT 9360 TaxID=2845821 RepID=UPI001E5D8567|nr:NAD(P)/FAD-dependent oxidoreductase [Bacillus sp. CECT 9360]CAH0345315.1 putative oxidoreductase CzcO [Bacillus sp. CECT 9360]